MNNLALKSNGSGLLRAILLVAVVLAAGLLNLAGCSKSEDSVNFPVQPPDNPYPWFFDVYGTGANDVWVAGNAGVMYHYDGTAWTRVEMGTDKAITALWGAGDGSLYACGYGGRIWRNQGGTWSSMNSGTSKDLLGLGSYGSAIHAVGREGVILRNSGGSWSTQPGFAVTRNPKEGNAVVDTLLLSEDAIAIKVVNHYMMGGAYLNPDFEGQPLGIAGSVGFTLKDDEPVIDPGPPPVDETGLYDWLLTPLGDDPLATPEWVIAGISDDTPGAGVPNNWYGTSTGWLYRLTESQETGRLNWAVYGDLPVTTEERYGVRDSSRTAPAKRSTTSCRLSSRSGARAPTTCT